MKKILLAGLVVFSSSTVRASFNVRDSIQKLDWNGIEVVYIEDSRFPTFDMTIYFADGALSDNSKIGGETSAAFDLTVLGTKKYSRDEIASKFEFYGSSSDVNVTHEYTTLTMSGLSKDILNVTKLGCEVLREANYPEAELKKNIFQQKNAYKGMETNHGALASRIFREVSLEGTPFSYPAKGKKKDLDLYTSASLRAKLDYFLNTVKKRIYLTGPKSILAVKDVFKTDCGFSRETSTFVRDSSYKELGLKKSPIVFVPVEKANQVQVIVGSFLNTKDIKESELGLLSSEYLGGGFTSKLMQEIRVKRGLTYSIGAAISSQKTYGRALISTFTKNETIDELLKVLLDAIESSYGKNRNISKKQLELVKQGVIGSYPFKFEKTDQFLNELLYHDHVGKNYDEIFKFQDVVKSLNDDDVARKIEQVFNRNRLTIMVLGDKSILSKLKKMGEVKEIDYHNYL